MTNPPRVLYILVCGSPMARDVGTLVDIAQDDGWEVCVITTPDGRNFVDVNALQKQTGNPVRSWYKKPGEPDQLPPATAMIVAPATVNTINKWAAGITDTLVLGLLVEGYGFEIPTAVVPYTNNVMARHPVLHESLDKLSGWGVHVLYDDRRLGGPGQIDRFRAQFPWRRALQAVNSKVTVEPGSF
ncbi:flavoprotein [Actinoplanes sp. NBRC 103695]|uniref:flavoprotein n=1 Tax=Actinoplanes sp. NBRC 103695 TaxID=3032202 RepID=UPI0024A1852F|nr:flavoprotein [Actinoplanes sp. NBRC 103695]GLY97668.1 flavoprotein [Actinoplanes sp. NBRC 103695]